MQGGENKNKKVSLKIYLHESSYPFILVRTTQLLTKEIALVIIDLSLWEPDKVWWFMDAKHVEIVYLMTNTNEMYSFKFDNKIRLLF